jgi:hypothetical protein
MQALLRKSPSFSILLNFQASEKRKEKLKLAKCQGLTPVIPATQEAEIRRTEV